MDRYGIVISTFGPNIEKYEEGNWCKWEDVDKLLNEIRSVIDFYDFDDGGNGYLGQLHEIEEMIKNTQE